MVQSPIRYDDGAAYERMMGAWSRIAGEIFLDWLAQRPGLAWVDVGCGNGAFTEEITVRFWGKSRHHARFQTVSAKHQRQLPPI